MSTEPEEQPLDATRVYFGKPGSKNAGMLNSRIGDYDIVREIGEGGMGIVYEAVQRSLNRTVAIKILPIHASKDPQALERFRREAQAAARLHHTNIVPVFEVGQDGDTCFYAMQYISGRGLDRVLDLARMRSNGSAQTAVVAETPEGGAPGTLNDSGPRSLSIEWALSHADSDSLRSPADEEFFRAIVSLLGLPQAGRFPTFREYVQAIARVGRQIAGALSYAHVRDVIHRDIKPSNLLLDEAGTVWVADFGLAKLEGHDNLTRAGVVMGTLRYLPPEAFEGRFDARGDIYALGLTLYELVSLRPAFEETDQKLLLRQVIRADIPRLEIVNPQTPRDLATIIHKACERDPAHRYQTAAELAAELQRFLNDEPIRARPLSTVERLSRWTKRNKAVAASLSAVALLLIVVATGALIAAYQFRQQELKQESLAKEQTKLAKDNDEARRKAVEAQIDAEDERHTAEGERRKAIQARDDAVAAQRQSEVTLADMHTTRGLIAAERQNAAEAALWFANAARLAGHDLARVESNQLRARNWFRQMIVPVAALAHPDRDIKWPVLQFHPAGRHLLVRNDRNTAWVWDCQNERPLAWADKLGEVFAACWVPGGEWLALGRAASVELRHFPSGEILRIDHPGNVTALAPSRDGRSLAIASNVVRIVNLSQQGNWATRAQWNLPAAVHSLVFSPDETLLAATGRDRLVQVFAVDPQRKPAPLFEPVPHDPDHESPPAFVDSGRGLITVSDRETGGELVWRDSQTGQPARLGKFRSHLGRVPRIVASHDGKWFAVGGQNGSLLWSVERPDAQGRLLAHSNYVSDLAFSPDDHLLLSANDDANARFWSLPDGKPLYGAVLHQGNVRGVAFSPDGTHFATAQTDGCVRVWRRPGESPPGDVTSPARYVDLRLSRDRRFAVTSRARPDWTTRLPFKHVRVFDLDAGAPTGKPITVDGSFGDADVADGGQVVAAAVTVENQFEIRLWNVESGEALPPRFPLPGPPRTVAISRDGALVAALCETRDVLVFDVGQQAEIAREKIKDGAGGTTFLEFTRQEDLLVLWSNGVSQLNLKTGHWREPCLSPHEFPAFCNHIEVSPDGERVAICFGGPSSGVQVWDLASGRAVSEVLLHPRLVPVTCFSGDGRYLFTGCRDGQARLWDVQTGELAGPPCRADDEVNAIFLTPDGRWGITGKRFVASGDGAVRVWDARSGKPIAPPFVIARGSPEDLKVSPNGRHILAVTEHSTIRRFDLAEVTSDDGEPLDELLRMTQLASGQQVFQGEVSGLSADEWDRLWAGRPHRAHAPVAVAADQPIEQGLPDDWIAKARELVSNGDIEPAVTAIMRAIELSTLKTVQAAIANDRIAWDAVLDELCRQHPQDEAYLRWRCDFHTSHGNWKQAAQAQTALVAHKPDDYFNYFLAAPLQLIAGDVAGYRATCRAMLERFGRSAEQDPNRAEQLSKTCLLAPGAVSDIDAVFRLAERAVTGTEKDPGYGWFVLARALAHYRQEQFAAAQERLTEYVARAAAGESISRNATARALLAMTQAKLGQLEDAKKSLESARHMVSQVIPHPEEGQFFSGDWSDWVRCLILLSEAEQVVGGRE